MSERGKKIAGSNAFYCHDCTLKDNEIIEIKSEVAELHKTLEALRKVVEAAKELHKDNECYCLNPEESLGRNPCPYCELTEALEAVKEVKG